MMEDWLKYFLLRLKMKKNNFGIFSEPYEQLHQTYYSTKNDIETFVISLPFREDRKKLFDFDNKNKIEYTYYNDTINGKELSYQDLLDKGYDVYMIMVYAHPMISYAANFGRDRALPAIAVFATWRNVYQLIGEYQEMLWDNLSIFVSDRGGKYKKEVEAFNKAAERGVDGIKEYLKTYNEEKGIGGSSFFEPVKMSKEEEDAFNQAVQDVEYDRDNRSEDKAVKKAFLKTFQKNGVGPGDDKLRDAVKKYRDSKEKSDRRNDEVLENIAEMLFSPEFQELLKHSEVSDIDRKVQAFLAW